MAEYEDQRQHHHRHHNQEPASATAAIPKETAIQAVNTIIQLHFEKTLEKKKSIDKQKKELHRQFLIFFLFLGLILQAQTQAHPTRLHCRHAWVPIVLLSLAHLIFYVSVAQTLRCINGFKYQRRCHKLTLALATETLRRISTTGDSSSAAGDLDIHYQEPPESYFAKFKRNWALHFAFLLFIYAFMISSSVVLLCY